MKHPIEAYRDPRSRPRALIWTGVVAIIALFLLTLALAVTSTNWFCTQGCHRIMDDAVDANAQSPHAKLSCIACHLPAGGDPVTFMIHKAGSGIKEVPPAIFGTYRLPLNPESEVALDIEQFPSTQCTQCHTPKPGTVTVDGIKIEHQVHADAGLQCTWCHNRVAHEEAGLKLATLHTDFISMEGCFRCHTLSGAGVISSCTTCHVTQPKTPPADHTKAFIAGGHASLVDAQGRRLRGKPATKTSRTLPTHFNGPADILHPIPYQRTCYNCHMTDFCVSCHRAGAYRNDQERTGQ
ncbi:MAG: NapC/NirT family cytochrome c [Actinomycetia bacterium]|nr:NapC/NirT family cytochrome c [Actinomycetes bacterium]